MRFSMLVFYISCGLVLSDPFSSKFYFPLLFGYGKVSDNESETDEGK